MSDDEKDQIDVFQPTKPEVKKKGLGIDVLKYGF
jgi:hypothetical protein